MHKAALKGCEWLQNGVREGEGVGLGMWSFSFGRKRSGYTSAVSVTKQWQDTRNPRKPNPKVLVTLLIN